MINRLSDTIKTNAWFESVTNVMYIYQHETQHKFFALKILPDIYNLVFSLFVVLSESSVVENTTTYTNTHATEIYFILML